MAVNLSPVGGAAAQFFTNNGTPLAGGKLFTYLAGTTTPVPSYTTSAGNVNHTNPIILDSAGRVPSGGEIWLADVLSYKFVLKDSTDVTIATYDNLIGINSNIVNYSNQIETFTATAAQTVVTLTAPYVPGANSLQVFVDGLRMYLGDYTETSTTTITFATAFTGGENILVAITNVISSAVDAVNVGYTTVDNETTSVAARFNKVVYVTDFDGVDPTGATDSTAGIQAAVDYLESFLSTSNYGGRGAALFFPDGEYLIQGTVEIGKTGVGGVGLFCNPSKGARLFTDQTSQTMFKVGDSTGAENVYEVHFTNLFFSATSVNNTGVVAIQGYNAFIVGIKNCVFRNFYEAILSERGNRWWVSQCRFWNNRSTAAANSSIRMYGNAGGNGGGWHILDNEFSADGTLTPGIEAHIVFEAVDSSYLVNNHFRDCNSAIKTAPTGAVGKNFITSIWATNNYFDNNYGPANVLIGGTIDWTAAGSVRYHHLHFTNNYFRGGAPGSSTNCVRIAVADVGTPDPSDNEGVTAISFTGGAMRQAQSTALLAQGSDDGYSEVYGLIVTGVTFEDNNQGNTAANSAIRTEAKAVVIDGCWFNRDTNASDRCINAVIDGGATSSPSVIISNNNFQLSNSTDVPFRVYQDSSTGSGGSAVVQGNILKGRGRDINQSYQTRTTNATPNTVFSYLIPDKSAGWFEVYATGIAVDGSKTVARAWRTAFSRNTTSSLSSGTTSGTEIAVWNPGSFGTLPSCGLSTNTLEVIVTGILATDIDWDVHVMIYGAR